MHTNGPAGTLVLALSPGREEGASQRKHFWSPHLPPVPLAPHTQSFRRPGQVGSVCTAPLDPDLHHHFRCQVLGLLPWIHARPLTGLKLPPPPAVAHRPAVGTVTLKAQSHHSPGQRARVGVAWQFCHLENTRDHPHKHHCVPGDCGVRQTTEVSCSKPYNRPTSLLQPPTSSAL